MSYYILILILTQILFTASDLTARFYMSRYGFTLNSFLSPWFLIYLLLRIPPTFGQLFVLSRVEIGKSMALFGAVSIVLSSVLGLLLFQELLTVREYVGIALAILAFLTLSIF